MSQPILLVQTAFLGDLLLTIPLLKQIRQIRPGASIHLVCRKGLGPLLKALGFVDEIHEIQKGRGDSYAAIEARLRALRFEWIFCPHPSVRSALLVSRLRARRKIGFRSFWNFFFFSDRAARVRAPEALRLLGLLTPLDRHLSGEFKGKFTLKWREWVGRDWNQKVRVEGSGGGVLPAVPAELSISSRDLLLRHQPVLPVAPRTWALFPGSVWATKQWPPEKFLELAEMILKKGDQVLWMGGPDEKQLCQELVEACPRSRSLAGQTDLWETLVTLSRCQGVVSNDSGGQHLAAVAGVPVVSVFGPTSLEFGFRPWSDRSAVAEVEGLFCRPCGPHGHRKCPRGTLECQKTLLASSVEEIRGELVGGRF